MAQAPMKRVRAASAAEICRSYELKNDARALLTEAQTPREFLDALLVERKFSAAIGFLAHALPPRDAIWWGCLCLEQASGATSAPAEVAAERAAVRWVLDPSEENRRAAKPAGDAAGAATPAGCLAMATAWTGGSLAPPIPAPHPKGPPIPPVPPDPFLPAKTVAGAVMLASVRSKPTSIIDTQRLFVEIGVGVAEGRIPWPEPRAPKQAEPERTWKRRETRI